MDIYPRSRAFILESIKKKPLLCTKANWNEIIPIEISDEFYSSIYHQIQFFNRMQFLTITEICSILGISSKTFYKILGGEEQDNVDKYEEEDMEDEEEDIEDKEEVAEDDEREAGRPPLVNDEEEALLLQQILECQQHGNCMTPREARRWLQQVVFNRGKVVALNRQWWYNFKEKHDRILKIMKIHSLEYKRFEVTEEQVVDYFRRLTNELAKCPYPPIIINIDETGFISRPCKNKSKYCVFRKDCNTHPCYNDCNDGYHVSVLAAVTLSGISLKPLLISQTEKPPKVVRDSPLGNTFSWYCTKSGYLNANAMIYWIKEILVPYLTYISSTIDFEITPLLLFDNLRSHLTDEVLQLLQDNNVRICCLPPHSSHILQVLDLSFFGAMKSEFATCEATNFDKSQKMACKIEKILKAYHFASFPTIIISGWKESGIDVTYSDSKIVKYHIKQDYIISKLIKH